MGAHSTLQITRTSARTFIYMRLFHMSDEEMEAYLDRVLDRQLYNTRIVDDGQDNDDDILLALR